MQKATNEWKESLPCVIKKSLCGGFLIAHIKS